MTAAPDPAHPATPGTRRIVSGGQTGVDRAALDTALALGIPCGGWVPRGRRAEDGRLPDRYPVQETPSGRYHVRTRLNVRESDGTLILCHGTPTGGTALTVSVAHTMGRPCLVVDLAAGEPTSTTDVRAWIARHGITTLNVAGPRESTAPGVYARAVDFLHDVLAEPAPL